MIRFVTLLVLLISVTACTSSFPLRPDRPEQKSSFETALQEFEAGDRTLMKELAKNRSASPWNGYARTILEVCNKKDTTIRTLRDKYRNVAANNKQLTEQNRTLQDNLDKLNQINLELEKRVN